MSVQAVSASSNKYEAVGGLVLLALQFGMQPLLSKSCIASGTVTSSLVLGAELFKLFSCIGILSAQGNLRDVIQQWTPQSCLIAAGIPSFTYVVQNYCIQIAYQNLDGIVFNVLNQSKVFFTACLSFLIVGKRQSPLQCFALLLVTIAGILVSMPATATLALSAVEREQRSLGIACVVLAAMLSGVGSAITEWSLQRCQRNNFLLSAEIAVLGCFIVFVNLVLGLTADSKAWRQEGLFSRWTLWTLVPVVTQGMAGILVGIVTKVAGGVRKVLATIAGLVLTCIVQHVGDTMLGFSTRGPPLAATLLAVPLVTVGVYLHASFPPKTSSKLG